MSDFLKRFKGLFIEEEPQKPGSAKPAPAAEAPTTAAPATSTPPPTPIVQASGQVSDRFVEILANALEQNNQSGFDYFEFRQSLANLSKMAMDEKTRYQSAYAMAQTMGATSGKLAESAQYYIQILQGEQSKFNEAHAQQRTKLIGSREEEIKTLEAGIQDKTRQISELTRQIEEHRQRSEQIRSEISASTIKIEGTKADFDATYAIVVAQLQEDVAKIKQYL
jgi:hypothetical protein